MNLQICSCCGESKVKQRRANRLEGSFAYVDERGKLWSGRVCPSCKNTNGKNAKESVYVKPKMNACKRCSHPTINRYFCTSCHSVLETSLMMDDFPLLIKDMTHGR